MWPDFSDVTELILSASAFGLVFSVWLVGVLLWFMRRSSSAHQIEERLGLSRQDDSQQRLISLWHHGRHESTSVPVQSPSAWLASLDRMRRQADWEIKAPALLAIMLAGPMLASAAIYLLTDSLLLGISVSGALLLMFWAHLKGSAEKRLALFENQFVESLDLAARSLRAGHPLIGAFRLISEEMPDPVRSTFTGICQRQALGLSLEGALKKAAADSHSSDMKVFATAVVIQLRSGGNLADMMQRLAGVVRDRLRLRRRVRILTTQTQLSKRVLFVLPIALFLLLNVINPGYMAPLYQTDTGRSMLGLAVVGVLIGVWLMNRLAVLRY